MISWDSCDSSDYIREVHFHISKKNYDYYDDNYNDYYLDHYDDNCDYFEETRLLNFHGEIDILPLFFSFEEYVSAV